MIDEDKNTSNIKQRRTQPPNRPWPGEVDPSPGICVCPVSRLTLHA